MDYLDKWIKIIQVVAGFSLVIFIILHNKFESNNNIKCPPYLLHLRLFGVGLLLFSLGLVFVKIIYIIK